MERIWTDPRDGKEWRVHFTWTPPGVAQGVGGDFRPGGPLDLPAPIVRFKHPVDPSKTLEAVSTARGDEDLKTISDPELMALLDKARKGEG